MLVAEPTVAENGKDYIALIERVTDSYNVITVEKEYAWQLYEKVENCGLDIVARGEGKNDQEAASSAINDQLSRTQGDETIGLHYHYLPTEILLNNIRAYRKLNLKKASNEELVSCLESIIVFHYVYFVNYKSLKGDTTLYRARKYDLTKPLFSDRSDLWCPASEYEDNDGNLKRVSTGRLNEEGESLLYLTMSVNTIPAELRLEEGDAFYIIKYKVKEKENLILSLVGMNEEDYESIGKRTHDKSKWTREARINHTIIIDFLKGEFVRDVGKRTEFLYRASVMIVKKYFSPPEIHGYLYPSVAYKAGHNLAIKEEDGRRVLEFSELRIFTYKGENENGPTFTIHPYYSCSIVNDEIQYSSNARPEDFIKLVS
jgi:hypothetical protein